MNRKQSLPQSPKDTPSDLSTGGSGGGGGDHGETPLGYYELRNVNWLAHLFQQSKFSPSTNDYFDFLSNASTYLKNLTIHASPRISSLAKMALSDYVHYGHSYKQFSERIRKRFQVVPWRLLVLPDGTPEPKKSVDKAGRILVKPEEHQGFIPRRFTWRQSWPGGMPIEAWEKKGGDYIDPFDFGSPLYVNSTKAPSQENKLNALDKLLTSVDLLYSLNLRSHDYPCLILQLKTSLSSITSLEDVFPAFELALNEANRWPGVLLWNLKGQKSFFPVPGTKRGAVEAISWILSAITEQPKLDPNYIKSQYVERKFYPKQDIGVETLQIIHTSDMHLGDPIANKRVTTIKNRIKQMVEDSSSTSIVPVITGDLMDTPSPKHLDNVLDYIHSLDNLGTERPVVVLGNHDVRKIGILNRRYEEALRLYMEPVAWFDRCKVGLLCFNSVRGGHLARGFIDENEFIAMGNELDRNRKQRRGYTLLALLHHHPTPVTIPNWYVEKWYMRWMGGMLETTLELTNAEAFLKWCSMRNIAAVLHGHKHIPRVEEKDGIAIFGCGSTTGKVQTASEGETYMSINVVNVNSNGGRISCRVRVERIVGAGLSDVAAHEILYRKPSGTVS